MIDVGCGIGGSSRHIAKKYACTANGITLSPYQANRGNELAKEQALDHLCTFQVLFFVLFLLLLCFYFHRFKTRILIDSYAHTIIMIYSRTGGRCLGVAFS